MTLARCAATGQRAGSRPSRNVGAARESYTSEIAEGRLDLREGDAGDLPWDDGTFDAVSIANALHIIDDPRPVLREACRVLKPGGRLALVTQAKEPIEARSGRPSAAARRSTQTPS